MADEKDPEDKIGTEQELRRIQEAEERRKVIEEAEELRRREREEREREA